MLTGTFCMSGAMTSQKLAAKLAPTVQCRFMRSMFCLIFATIYAKAFKGKSLSLGDIENKKSLFMRVGMTVFQTFAQMYVARKLPLGLTAALMGMSPVTTSILNRIVLGTQMSTSQWACTMTTVCGVFLISQPAFIFGESGVNDFEEYDAERYIAIGLAVAMNVMRALTMILNKKMMMEGGQRLHFSQFTFYNSLMAVILCLGLQGPNSYKLVQIPSMEAVAYILGGSLLFFTRPLLMDMGLGARLPMSLITILRSSSIIWAFLFQLMLFGEVPSMMEATGISVIVGCATLMFHLTGGQE